MLPPEVFHGQWELRSVALLDRQDVSRVVVRTDRDYFRTPLEWLKAAKAWQGPEATDVVGPRMVTGAQETLD